MLVNTDIERNQRRLVKFLATISIILLLPFIACDEEDNTAGVPDPVPTKCLLKSFTTGTDIAVTITYNSKGLPTMFEQIKNNGAEKRTDTFEYDGADNVIKISSKNGYMEYEYNANKKVISTKAFLTVNGSSELRYDALHHYNIRGQLDSTVVITGGVPSLGNDRFEYDADGNVIKVFNTKDGVEKLIRENLAVDNKKASFGNYYGYFIFVSPGVDLTRLANPVVSIHNITKAKFLTAGGSWSDVDYTFEYNELGYPTKVTSHGVTTIITNYTYDCD